MSTPVAPAPKPKSENVEDLFAGDDVPLSEEELAVRSELEPVMLDLFEQSGAKLPAFPLAAARMFEVANGPNPEMSEIVRLLGSDPALSAQVLRAANSAFYSRGQPMKGLRDAVVRLGLKDVARVASMAAANSIFDPAEAKLQANLPHVWKRLWLHSVTTALGASSVAMHARRMQTEEVFLGGLLHDVGRLAVLRTLSSLAIKGKLPPGATEAVTLDLIDACGEKLGALVAAACRFPDTFVRYCTSLTSSPPEARELNAVMLASSLDALASGDRGRAAARLGARRSAIALGVDEHGLRALATELKQLGARATAMASAVR